MVMINVEPGRVTFGSVIIEVVPGAVIVVVPFPLPGVVVGGAGIVVNVKVDQSPVEVAVTALTLHQYWVL